jgi:hypothetical protein
MTVKSGVNIDCTPLRIHSTLFQNTSPRGPFRPRSYIPALCAAETRRLYGLQNVPPLPGLFVTRQRVTTGIEPLSVFLCCGQVLNVYLFCELNFYYKVLEHSLFIGYNPIPEFPSLRAVERGPGVSSIGRIGVMGTL